MAKKLSYLQIFYITLLSFKLDSVIVSLWCYSERERDPTGNDRGQWIRVPGGDLGWHDHAGPTAWNAPGWLGV